MKKNENGFAIAEIGLIGVICLVISATGWYVWQSRNNANKSLKNASSLDSPAQSGSNKKTDTTKQTTQTNTTSTPQNSNSKPSTTTTPKSNTTTPPKPPTLTPSLSLSDDNCTVTATGTQGFGVAIAMEGPDDNFINDDHTLPFSGSLTVSTKAKNVSSIDVTLTNTTGTQLFHIHRDYIDANCS